jgi:hypothetical protein
MQEFNNNNTNYLNLRPLLRSSTDVNENKIKNSNSNSNISNKTSPLSSPSLSHSISGK